MTNRIENKGDEFTPHPAYASTMRKFADAIDSVSTQRLAQIVAGVTSTNAREALRSIVAAAIISGDDTLCNIITSSAVATMWTELQTRPDFHKGPKS